MGELAVYLCLMPFEEAAGSAIGSIGGVICKRRLESGGQDYEMLEGFDISQDCCVGLLALWQGR